MRYLAMRKFIEIPEDEKIITTEGLEIVFTDSEMYDAIMIIRKKNKEVESHFWNDGKYDGYSREV